jgi:hypothetical protein
MARKRSFEPEISVSPAAAAARRKAAAPRKKHTLVASVAEPASEPVSETSADPATSAYRPTREDIAALAYSYWVARGYRDGSPEEDWLRAERELGRAAQAVNV